MFMVGYSTRYRGTCTWLYTTQVAEVHVQYTAGYYTVYRGTYRWLDTVPCTEVHVLGWILYRSQRYMYHTQLATIQCIEGHIDGWTLYRVQKYMYLAGYYTGHRGTCTIHSWLLYSVQRTYRWLDTVPCTEVHVLGWILYRLQRYMYSMRLATTQCTEAHAYTGLDATRVQRYLLIHVERKEGLDIE
jgi:hypothetical protein